MIMMMIALGIITWSVQNRSAYNTWLVPVALTGPLALTLAIRWRARSLCGLRIGGLGRVELRALGHHLGRERQPLALVELEQHLELVVGHNLAARPAHARSKVGVLRWQAGDDLLDCAVESPDLRHLAV